jgi:aminoglycoside phosphotransferase (APT) family kinase protein
LQGGPAGGETPGIDVSAVEKWLGEHVDRLTPPFRWTRLAGGHSNLTYRIDDAEARVAVVRRPPLGKLLPKAHDMGREFRIISGLWPTAVPVPEPLGYCEDPSVTGAHFYAMGWVEGFVLWSRHEVEKEVPEARRLRIGESFIDVLAALHSIEPASVGLEHLGRPDAYVARQLHRWYSSWQASREAAGVELPVIDALHERLSAQTPEQGPARVVHGDYALHNVLIGHDHRVAAVLDWEISTLGDPLADLGYALNAWVEPGDVAAARDLAPTTMPGFPSRHELLARYAERTGRDVSQVRFYEAFNHWKTACIVQGVYARYRLGQKSTEGVDMEGLRARIARSADLAEKAAEDI